MAVASARDLRRTNRSAILRELLFATRSSRQALAARTGCSAATVGLVVADLMGEGLVVEVGTEESNGGRPRTIVQLAADRGISVGVDVGERGLRVEAFDLNWERRGDTFVDLNAAKADPAAIVDTIARTVEEVVAAANVPSETLLGVGVSVPGIVERIDSADVHAVAFGWEGVPLGRMLREAIPAPVLVDNGAKTMGQAEMWFGAGRGSADTVVALLGIGVGAAVFTQGRLYRGSQSSAGEWGHTPVVVDGERCRCGSHGCLEAYVGESTVLRRWMQEDPAASHVSGPDTARLEALFATPPDGEPAHRVLTDFERYLGAGLATLINLFNPQRIVLGGSVGLRLPPRVLDAVRARAGTYSLRQPFESVEIVQGQLGDDAVALGAATLVVDGLLARGFFLPPADRARRALAGGVR